jgi:ATP-dependent DNA ligase
VKASALPSFVEPMKAKLASVPSSGDWIYEIKFDGWRALALKGGNQVRLFSRNSKDLGAKFPEIMVSIAELNAHDAIIDGEIVALDEKGRSSFQLLQAHDMGPERPPIFFYAFDLLRLNGKDLKNRPLEERKLTLHRLLEKSAGCDPDSFPDDFETLLESPSHIPSLAKISAMLINFRGIQLPTANPCSKLPMRSPSHLGGAFNRICKGSLTQAV